MKRHSKALAAGLLALAIVALPEASVLAAGKAARITQVVREVKLLPSDAEARPAALNDQVREGIAIRTGDRSRSELTFPDVTITRLGANTVFTFDRGGHGVNLDGGSVLLRVPKNSGGGNVRTNAVSVAITGTTLILETGRGGRAKLMMLEGSGRLLLRKYRNQFRDVRAGQMLEVPAGANTLPMPQEMDLNQVMQSHPLVAEFPPLPSRDLILAEARNPRRPGPGGEPVYEGKPVDGEPPSRGPVISVGGNVGLPGLFPGSRNPGRGSRRDPRRPPRSQQPTQKANPNSDDGPG
ncbi:MAG: FecR family protein [Chthoniobacterales bacterium]